MVKPDRGDEPVEPHKAGAVGRRRPPEQQREVMLAQAVAESRLGGVEVVVAVIEEVLHARSPHGGLREQPAVPLVLVSLDDLLGDLVDVLEAEVEHEVIGGREDQRVALLPVQLTQAPRQVARVPDPVGARQRYDGDTALRQSARVLDRRGGASTASSGNRC